MKHKKYWKIAALVIGVILLLLLGLALLWVRNNTSFLTTSIPEQELLSNNLNQGSEESFELVQTILANDKIINLPRGFSVGVFAEGIESARFMTVNENDTLFVGTKNSDKIYALRDTNDDGVADQTIVVDEGLNVPHSVHYFEGDLYLAEETRVSVYRDMQDDGTYATKDVLIDGLPEGDVLQGGGHNTRTVVIGPDRKLYVAIGSSCNLCEEDDERRATIMRYDLDGSNAEIYATGLRNTVGFLFDEDQLIGVDMGRDRIGDDVPPEELNRIQQGKDYGWPYCYGSKVANPEYADRAAYCEGETESPIHEMQAHSAPLGIAMLNDVAKNSWPEQYANGYFIAFHGSWNRTIPTGYKVVFVQKTDSGYREYNFLSGWLEENAQAWGRPVDIVFDNDGAMYLSDDKTGFIYKITYEESRN